MDNTAAALRQSRGLVLLLVVTVMLALVSGKEEPVRSPHSANIEEPTQ